MYFYNHCKVNICVENIETLEPIHFITKSINSSPKTRGINVKHIICRSKLYKVVSNFKWLEEKPSCSNYVNYQGDHTSS